ncbi:MAG: mannitol dehydrogenase family protein [Hyphomicrobiales bacterium]
MTRLSATQLPALARRGIQTPGYDRAALRPGLGHIGVGAFHRCHQAEFTEDLLEMGAEDRYLTGIVLRPPWMSQAIRDQSGLYTRTLVAGQSRDIRVIGAYRKVIDCIQGADDALRVLADPRMQVFTITVTEKGYCHIPSTGVLDLAHPDIVADLQNPTSPTSLIGLLVEGLRRRSANGTGGLALVSCDNVPGNGTVLGQALIRMAEVQDPPLADWIAANCRFPETMIDRIVPASTDVDRAAVHAATGLIDAIPVVGEPFRQWIIQESEWAGMPKWDRAGAQFTKHVTEHERIKMRLLNGAQSSVAHIGALLGIEHSCDAIEHPPLRSFVRDMLTQESARTLPADIIGMELPSYIDRTMERISNQAIKHRNHQIATDGSAKIGQRLLAPALELLNAGAPAKRLSIAAASWAAYLAVASRRYGARWQAQDPLSDTVNTLVEETDGPAQLADAILSLDQVFPKKLAVQKSFRDTFSNAFENWILAPSARSWLGVE